MQTQPIMLSYQDQLRALVENRIAGAVRGVEPDYLRSVLCYATRGGKRVRPLLTMLACGAAGGVEEQAVGVAAAVELLHTSSLIHDDIMDGATLRRSQPTVHTQFDVPAAILAGDTLIALAYKELQATPPERRDRILQVFSGAFLNTCEGQGYDLSLSLRPIVGKAEHRHMVEKKTAKLLEASAAIGALVATGDDEPVTALARFGYNIGMAYQIQDDLLDASAEEDVVGKSIGVDTMNNRQTFLKLAYSNSVDVLVPEHDSKEQLSVLIRRYTRKAHEALRLLPPTPAREYLTSLADSFVDRRS